MKSKLLICAMLATTALTPSPAHAGPVAPFVAGFSAAFGASATTAAVASGIGGATAAGFAAGTFVASTVGGVLISVGLSAISAKLNQVKQQSPSEAMVNFAQPISFAEWSFGRTRKGGPLAFTGFAEGSDVATNLDGGKRHYSPIMAMHECKGIVEHYLDDKPYIADEFGSIRPGTENVFYRVRPFTGEAGQVVDPELAANFSEITPAFDFVGLCGAHIWARRPKPEFFNDVYPNGRQANYAPVFDGHNGVYNPITDVSEWTQDAALIIAKIITDVWGQQVDWDLVAEQSAIASVQYPVRGGGLRDRWQINGTISDGQTYSQQQSYITAACDVWWYELPSGAVGFKLGHYEEPTITLTDADFLSVQKSTGNSKLGTASEIAVRYTEPDNLWRETTSASVVVDANARQNKTEPEAFLITNHNQAYRMARRLAALENPEYMISGTLKGIGRRLRGHRFVRMAFAGWPEFVIEVGKLTDNRNGTFAIEGVSVQAGDFEPDISDIEPETPAYLSVQGSEDIEDISGFSGQAVGSGQIEYTWDAPDDDSLRQRIRWRKTGDADYQIITVEGDQASKIVTGLGDELIEAQAQNITGGGSQSAWLPLPADITEAAINNTPPDGLVSFAALASGADVDVTFQTPNDPNYTATRIFRADYPGGYDANQTPNAVLIHTEYGAPNQTESWSDPAPPAGDHAYWGVPINQSGKPGNSSGPEIITTV